MEFDNAISHIAHNIKRTLMFVPYEIKQKCNEIRLRAGLPLCLTVGRRVLFVCKNSKVSDVVTQDVFTVTKDDVQQSVALLCKQSVYLHENEIKQGFISLSDGSRVGVCGVFNGDGMLVSVSSINIRIARQIYDCARCLLPHVDGGLLIAGPPGCGKTTILRDLVRMLSNGQNGTYYKISVIDSRNEISGGGTLDTGVNTDILYTSDKAKGVDIALRTMFPDFIVFDEIGTHHEYQSVCSCFNAGVGIITTAHCSGKEDILSRDIVCKIIKSGAVSKVALLTRTLGQPPEILDLQELKKHVYD